MVSWIGPPSGWQYCPPGSTNCIEGDVTPSSAVMYGTITVPPQFYSSLIINVDMFNWGERLGLWGGAGCGLLAFDFPTDFHQRDWHLEASVFTGGMQKWVTVCSGVTQDPKPLNANKAIYGSGYNCGVTTDDIPQRFPVTNIDVSPLAFALSEQMKRSGGSLSVRMTLQTWSSCRAVSVGFGCYASLECNPKWHIKATFNFANVGSDLLAADKIVATHGQFDSPSHVWSDRGGTSTWSQIINHPESLGITSCGSGYHWDRLLHNVLKVPVFNTTPPPANALLGDCYQTVDFPLAATYPDVNHAYPYRVQLILNARGRGWEDCYPWLSDWEHGGCSIKINNTCCGSVPNPGTGRIGQRIGRYFHAWLDSVSDANDLGLVNMSMASDNDIAEVDAVVPNTGRRVVIEVPTPLLPRCVGTHTLILDTDASFAVLQSGDIYFTLRSVSSNLSGLNITCEFHAFTQVGGIIGGALNSVSLDVLGVATIPDGGIALIPSACTLSPLPNPVTDTAGNQWQFDHWVILDRTTGTQLLSSAANPLVIDLKQDVVIEAIYAPYQAIPLWVLGLAGGGAALLAVTALATRGGGGGKTKSVAR